jgi:hypothetical protein
MYVKDLQLSTQKDILKRNLLGSCHVMGEGLNLPVLATEQRPPRVKAKGELRMRTILVRDRTNEHSCAGICKRTRGQKLEQERKTRTR